MSAILGGIQQSHLIYRRAIGGGVTYWSRSFASRSFSKTSGSSAATKLASTNEATTGTSPSPTATTAGTTPPVHLPWKEEKLKRKERRRFLYEKHQERLERLKTRREGKPFGEKRAAFLEWFVPRRNMDNYLIRKARREGLEWKIQVATILERPHVVHPDPPEWELKFENLRAHLEQFDRDYPEEFMPKVEPKPFDENHDPLQAAIDILKRKGVIPPPRETEADRTGDVRTINRKLKTDIFLLVRENGLWKLPTAELRENENLLEASKRSIPEMIGTDVKVWSLSNCPMGNDIQPFPENERQKGFFGTHTFFMRIYCHKGAVKLNDALEDFAWLDRDEIIGIMKEQHGEDTSKFYHYLL